MLDHDADAYEKISRAFLDGQPSGGLTKDHVLDNITLYWLSSTAASAARLYWATGRGAKAAIKQPPPPHLTLPVAYTVHAWAQSLSASIVAASTPAPAVKVPG